MPPSHFFISLAESVAEPTGGALQSPDPQLLDLDGTLFVQLGLFLAIMLLLTQLLWKPYLKIRNERTTRVDGYRADAKRMETESVERLRKIEADLGEARRTGSADRAKARAAAQEREQVLVGQAQAEAGRALAAARAALETTLTTERGTLKSRAEVLGRQAAERILGRKVA